MEDSEEATFIPGKRLPYSEEGRVVSEMNSAFPSFSCNPGGYVHALYILLTRSERK